MRVVSVGYQGRTLDELVELLAAAAVTTVADVRLHPSSRTPGFSKRRLAEALAGAGVDYVHLPDLGTPKELRPAFQRGDGSEGRALLRQRLEHAGGEGARALERLVALAGDRSPVAVLCLEREPERCHRRVLTTLIGERRPDLDLVEVR